MKRCEKKADAIVLVVFLKPGRAKPKEVKVNEACRTWRTKTQTTSASVRRLLAKGPSKRGEDARACVAPRMNETDITDTKQLARLLEKTVEKESVRRAAEQVIRNKGAGGIDGMQLMLRSMPTEARCQERKRINAALYKTSFWCRLPV